MKTFLLLTAALTLPAAAQLALIRQGRESAGVPETGDRFGFAVCAGDFNNDGFDDLATGSPYEVITGTSAQAGFVTINRGSRFGLTWVNAMGMSPGNSALSNAESHQMGYALASADFNNDGFDDLAVGLPASTINSATNSGRVLIYMGGTNGLSATASQVLTQTPFGGVNEAGDRFGAALAAGRLGTDNYADLVIGAPGENAGSGAIYIMRGGAAGLTTAVTGISSGAAGAPAGGAFGSSLAIGNVIGQVMADVLVGAPETDTGIIDNAGMVHLLIGNGTSVSTVNALHFDAAADGEFYQTNGRFGAALVVGDFYADDGELDVAIGAPGRNTGRGSVSIARGGLLALQWGTVLTAYANQDNALYGSALAAGDWDADGDDDLAVGSPYNDASGAPVPADNINSGLLVLFLGGPAGPASQVAYDELEASAGYGNNAQMGSSLAFGRFGAGPRASLAIGCPARDTARGQVLDYAPWRQVDSVQCKSALAADCENNVVYALRPFDQVSIASTTKIMTVLLACEATQRPLNDPLRVGLEEEYTIEPWMMEAYPPTSGCSTFTYYSPAFDHFTLRELMHSAMIPSGNDSCYAIADAMTGEINAWVPGVQSAPNFIALMNARGAQIGMNDSLFASASGAVDAPAHYSTAYDMWLLGRAAMQNPLFREMANTVEFDVPKLVPGAEAGIFESVVDHLSWGWLTGLKNREPRIVGCKPGSTGGAKHTGVVAARQSVFPNGLAYATGFGFETSSLGMDQLAELVQLALAECDPNYSAPDELAGPLAERRWTVNDAQRSALGLTEFARAADATDEETTLILNPLAPVVPGQPKIVQWHYNTMWELAPGQTATVQVRIAGRVTGVVSDPSGSSGNTLFVGGGTGGAWTTSLSPGGTFALTPWQSRTAEPFSLSITNAGATTALCVLDATFAVHPDFLWWPSARPTYRVELRNDTRSIRTMHDVREAPLSPTTSAPFPMLVALEDRGTGQRLHPPVEVTAFTLIPGTSAAGVDFLLPIDGIKGESEFYDAYDVQWSSDLTSASWQRLARLPVNATGRYQWQGGVPPGARRGFLRVRGVPSAD